MKERGIIFNGEMVRAILDGRKTQTRRAIKPQRTDPAWSVKPTQSPITDRHTHDWWLPTGTKPYSSLPCCPFGMVGDRLWVRETFADVNTENGPAFTYRADDGLKFCLDDESPVNYERYPGKNFAMWCGDLWRGEDGHIWTPSIHMPRWASRITLEITDVRVERLNSISESDALAEGFTSTVQLTESGDDYTGSYPSEKFSNTWQSIYGAESWDANPWCWVITFRRIEGD
ncbi:hypothetical protein H4F39_07395 [Pectobacterium brasiliense]|uniref:hypothetical protein n=1 Tax=Pectobacterium brasiliense TaxID=180957 RepID=UPI001969C6B9|nr:hypothetical protein [Pectobacterium brasiliense]MBN3093513.1 hypothetical protein [Pectobacterium brasiliense]